MAVDATVRCDTTVDAVMPDKAALATTPVPAALGAVNRPAAAVVNEIEALVKTTLLTE